MFALFWFAKTWSEGNSQIKQTTSKFLDTLVLVCFNSKENGMGQIFLFDYVAYIILHSFFS